MVAMVYCLCDFVYIYIYIYIYISSMHMSVVYLVPGGFATRFFVSWAVHASRKTMRLHGLAAFEHYSNTKRGKDANGFFVSVGFRTSMFVLILRTVEDRKHHQADEKQFQKAKRREIAAKRKQNREREGSEGEVGTPAPSVQVFEEPEDQ